MLEAAAAMKQGIPALEQPMRSYPLFLPKGEFGEEAGLVTTEGPRDPSDYTYADGHDVDRDVVQQAIGTHRGGDSLRPAEGIRDRVQHHRADPGVHPLGLHAGVPESGPAVLAGSAGDTRLSRPREHGCGNASADLQTQVRHMGVQ